MKGFNNKIKIIICCCFVLCSVFLICSKTTTCAKAEEVEQIGSDAIEEMERINNDEQTAKF